MNRMDYIAQVYKRITSFRLKTIHSRKRTMSQHFILSYLNVTPAFLKEQETQCVNHSRLETLSNSHESTLPQICERTRGETIIWGSWVV